MTFDIKPRQAAQWFAGNGYKVLPLHSVTDAGACTCGKADCSSSAKHPFAPLAPHGLKDATDNADIVRGWFGEHHWLNYGVLSDPFVVIDVDVKNGGVERWREMCAQTTRGFIHTWTVATGSGGQHLFFQNPNGVRNGALDRGIDLRGVGGYVVGPASKHASGKLYTWAPQCCPKDAELAELPDWLDTIIKNRSQHGRVVSLDEWRRRVSDRVPDGERHERFLQFAGHLIANPLLDPIIARDLLLAWNRQNFDPPLAERDAMAMIENLAARERAKQRWSP
jgi:hypothetical protein